MFNVSSFIVHETGHSSEFSFLKYIYSIKTSKINLLADEKRPPRSVNVAGNQARHFPPANHNGSSTAARMPAFKLKEQDATSLAEIAMSLASEMDEYLASTDQGGLTNRRVASVRDEERIGTPVKVKKSKAKSPTRAEKQPLTIPRQVAYIRQQNSSFTIVTCIKTNEVEPHLYGRIFSKSVL